MQTFDVRLALVTESGLRVTHAGTAPCGSWRRVLTQRRSLQVLQAEALAVGAFACLHNPRMIHKLMVDGEQRTKAHGLTQPGSLHALMV